MKKLYVLFLVLIISIKSFTQCAYDSLKASAKLAHQFENYQDEFSLLSQVVRFQLSTPSDYEKLIEVTDKIKLNEKKQYKIVKEGLEKGLSPVQMNQLDLIHLKKSIYWDSILTIQDSLYKSYLLNLDQDWIQLLANMKYIDQEIRKRYLYLAKDSLQNEILSIKFRTTIDSLNWINLTQMIHKKGFPTVQEIGHSAMNNLWLLLWHHRESYLQTDEWLFIQTKIIERINNQQLRSDYLTYFEDYKSVKNNEPMKFGTMLYYYSTLPMYNEMLLDKAINSNREKVGLCSIQLYLKSEQLPLPKYLKD